MKQQLEKYLFRKDTHTYAVLDGASVPDLPNKLYEMAPVSLCLYRGKLSPDIVYTAPYLVHLFPGTPFTDWLLAESWGKHWGIFAQSPLSMPRMQKHFRLFLTVYDDTGKPMLFRFYDPRVLSTFLKSSKEEELKVFFEKIKYYFVELPEESQLSRFDFTDSKLKETKLKIEVDK